MKGFVAALLIMFALPVGAAEAQFEASGSLTINWAAPTTNVDGSPLTDLAGYKLYWGRTKGGPYTESLTIDDAGRTSATIQFNGIDQAETWWFFVGTAFDESGNESVHSNEVMKKLVVEISDDMPPNPMQLSSEIEFSVEGCVVVSNPSATCSVRFE